MDLAGGGTGTPVARGGAWGRQSRSETNARRDASRTRDSKRSYRSEPAVSGWRVEVASGPTSVGRQPTRARAVRACARSPRAGEEVRKRGGWVGREDARGRAIQRKPEERADQRVDVGRDGHRTTTVLGERARREGVEVRAATRGKMRADGGRTCDTSGVTPRPLGRHHGDADSANAPAHRRTARPNLDDDESSCCSATRIFEGERGGRSDYRTAQLRKVWRRQGHPSVESESRRNAPTPALARLTLPPLARFSTGSRTP